MQNLNPKISIVFPCYNGEKYLNRMMDSIKQLDNLNEIELVIVDNNSEDKSKQIINSYKNIKINLIEQDQNLGFAKACNIGVNNSIGEYVFITNQDVVFPNDFFLQLLMLLDITKKKDQVILCPAVVFFNNNINYYGAKIHFLGFSYTPEMYQKIPTKISTFQTLKASGCSLFLQKQTFFELNGFDPYFFMYHEDTDFSLMALRNNIPIYTTNKTLLIHQKEHLILNDFSYYYIERNRYFCLIKNIEKYKILIPYLIITELMLLIQAFLIKKIKTRFKVYKFLIQHRKELSSLRYKATNINNQKLNINHLSRNLDPIILGPNLSNTRILIYFLKILNFIM